MIKNMEKNVDYKYTTLIDVMKNIAEDMSDENIEKQVARLTSDEIRKFSSVLDFVQGRDSIWS